MIKGLLIYGISLMTFTIMSMESQNSFVTPLQLSVIVNSETAPETLDMKGLRSLLKGEKQRWGDGTKITLALMKTNTDIGSDMTKRVFLMTEKELNKYFLAKVFQGKMSSPEFFDNEEDLRSYVKSTRGAISVIESLNSDGFKTITIDGKKSF
ncbi:MAG: hypothetical protein HRT71_02110 [Flavobacteriales bacterium]|nr:hypothetical protein [Flavobacteriales bacterium]